MGRKVGRPTRHKDLTGQTFGCLTVLEFHNKRINKTKRWVDGEQISHPVTYYEYVVECECGKRKIMNAGNISLYKKYLKCPH